MDLFSSISEAFEKKVIIFMVSDNDFTPIIYCVCRHVLFQFSTHVVAYTNAETHMCLKSKNASWIHK